MARKALYDYDGLASTSTYRYYVINRENGIWVKISEDYSDVRDAAEALRDLKGIYPEARLGGSRTLHG